MAEKQAPKTKKEVHVEERHVAQHKVEKMKKDGWKISTPDKHYKSLTHMTREVTIEVPVVEEPKKEKEDK